MASQLLLCSHYLQKEKSMKVLVFLFTVMTLEAGASVMAFPKSPDPKITPGSLCTKPTTYRHPERIPYCERAVNSYAKELIFIAYRKDLGFSLSGDRADYKVDHFIPLCFGGSNEDDNLWPQHKSLSKVTDIIESQGCEKLGKGKLTQKDAIDMIVRAKLNLTEAPAILKRLKKIQ
jgi:hypothetical protein